MKTTSDLVEDQGHMFLAPQGMLIPVPMPEPRQWRVIAHLTSGSKDLPTAIDAAQLDKIIRERTGLTFGVHDATWTSQFDLTHGVADTFRSGRIFLAGDAAHIHSPVGGQGLNTGVQDVHNLLWRIVESKRATPQHAEELLAAYGIERRGTARALVGGVARMTRLMTSSHHLVRRLRSSVAPLIMSRPFVQARLARGIGMLNLSYSKRITARAVDRSSTGRRQIERGPPPAESCAP